MFAIKVQNKLQKIDYINDNPEKMVCIENITVINS